MPQRTMFKSLLILVLLVLFGYSLIPTVKYLSLSMAERDQMRVEQPEVYNTLVKKAIKLGLDLQGGMHVVLEVDLKELLQELANKGTVDERFHKALDAAAATAAETGANIVDAFDQNLQEMGVDIALYYRNRELQNHDQVVEYLTAQRKESIDRALEVLRNRVDEFGVSEPIIQKQGNNRIIVQLAGISNRDQARELVGKTAKLEFSLLKDPTIAERAALKINDYLAGEESAADSTVAAGGDSLTADTDTTAIAQDSSVIGGEDLFASSDSTEQADEETALFQFSGPGFIFIDENDAGRFQRAMNDSTVQRIIEREAQSAKFLLSTEDIGSNATPGKRFLRVYLVNANPALDGSTIIDAKHSMVDRSVDVAGGFETSITFNDEGTRAFASVTGANVGKQLAIILDNKVQSAPNIQERISRGRARITGLDSNEEAKVLASVLKAGSLPTPMKIIEERTVGASLGADSINKGFYSTLFGLALVAIFMMIYYRISGLIANVALILNVVLLMGVMSTMHATLTLPGIAGIILTIGMAVDANVLIFERIREELDRGKSTWAALDTGYGRAFVTILDANITTFIAGVVLYNFGSGPVRGFAITLMIGIVASMFTAIFVTRTISELLLSKKILKQISI
ncbi:MAG: protein translocase subunit SecD [Calditrichaeota bacterium]|nr:protein translocase subunit SecD [Calditrichota bacterium]MCB0304098.1 protein translocase subunit SecD [Calditrichota bacterium]